MERMTFSKRGGRVRTKVVKDRTASDKSTEDVVRDIKTEMQKSPGKDYRERSLAIYGLVCARCAREFNEASRHLLTVHHKDGNMKTIPPMGATGRISVSTVMMTPTAGEFSAITLEDRLREENGFRYMALRKGPREKSRNWVSSARSY